MGLLTIEGHQGALLNVRAVGADAEAAMAEIAELFENKFFED
jgi:phosphotransferase system HPr-like phosphotransfer protein